MDTTARQHLTSAFARTAGHLDHFHAEIPAIRQQDFLKLLIHPEPPVILLRAGDDAVGTSTGTKTIRWAPETAILTSTFQRVFGKLRSRSSPRETAAGALARGLPSPAGTYFQIPPMGAALASSFPSVPNPKASSIVRRSE